MAWVHRTTRDNNKVGLYGSTTPSHVGPGSYKPRSAFDKKGPSFAPFASTADRSGGVLAEVTAHSTPGPGAYRVEGSNPKQIAHNASTTPFLSFQERFKRPANFDTPGPGAYKIKSTFRKQRGKRNKGGGDPTAAVTWVRVPTAPSIPAPSQSYGYEEGDYGQLTMQKPPAVGHTGRGKDTAGPGSYNPDDRVKAGRQQVAVDFSRSRTTRTDFAKSEVPGPGEYEVTKTPVFGPGAGKKSGARASANFASRVSRSGPVRRRRHRTPGPGSYQVPGAFKNQYVPERQQFFGSTTRRFQAPRSHSATVPGPGAYDTSANDRGGRSGVRSATARSRKAVTSHVGFTSTSARFGVAKPSSEKPTPGAGTYEAPTFVADMQKRPTARNGVFGSTSKRFFQPGNTKVPGPGAYDAAVKPSKRTADLAKKPLSVFASRNDRFKHQIPTTDVPPPGSYNVTPSWNTSSFARRRGGKGMLASGPQRFGSGGTVNADQLAAPGPGAYDPPVDKPRVDHRLVNRKNVMVSNAPRFKSMAGVPQDAVPGPGSYDTEYVYGSLHKRTFNMTIAEQEAGW